MSDQQKKKFSALADAGRQVDRQVQRLVDYVNTKVVPAAREDTEVLLRRASEKLKEMADRLAEDIKKKAAPAQAPAQVAPAQAATTQAKPKAAEPKQKAAAKKK